jgi:hypothetical protein
VPELAVEDGEADRRRREERVEPPLIGQGAILQRFPVRYVPRAQDDPLHPRIVEAVDDDPLEGDRPARGVARPVLEARPRVRLAQRRGDQGQQPGGVVGVEEVQPALADAAAGTEHPLGRRAHVPDRETLVEHDLQVERVLDERFEVRGVCLRHVV